MTREQPKGARIGRRRPGQPAANCATRWWQPGLWLLLLGGADGFAASLEQTNSASPLDYQAFKIIAERNIFNTRRYTRGTTSRRESRPATRVESFALLGTMSYEKGPFAFFEGSRSDYQKVAKPADTIAGYTIAEIQPAYVRLNSGTNEVQLRVGMQLRREDEGEWHVTERVEPEPISERPVVSSAPPTNAAPAAPTAGSPGEAPPPIIIVDGEPIVIGEGPPEGVAEPAPNAPASSAPAAAGSADEVLRRLMERRRQEENP